MITAWYERPGPAAEVLQIGEMADPEPGHGEVRVLLTFSGINPGDTKKRSDWTSSGIRYPRVIPHSDGAGVVDAVGDDVCSRRLGERVWVYGAQSYQAFGTAAQLTVVPAAQAVPPRQVGDEVGACLGIPGITAHRAVFPDGPVAGATVLVPATIETSTRLSATWTCPKRRKEKFRATALRFVLARREHRLDPAGAPGQQARRQPHPAQHRHKSATTPPIAAAAPSGALVTPVALRATAIASPSPRS
jgi:hypothetical protein